MGDDTGLDTLLALDGEIFVIDPAGGHWVKFRAVRTEATSDRPHGVSYTLTLHAADGERLVGFDNAHPVKRGAAFDHRHRGGSTHRYDYADAATLLSDFWAEVETVLKERGVSL